MPHTARFNLICRVIATLWLVTALPISIYLRTSYQDFQAFYAAGVTARLGEWNALYPERDPNSPYFIYSGFRWKPRQIELANQFGYTCVEPFIQPPWVALLFVPFAYLPYDIAHKFWMALLIFCAVVLAMLAGQTARWAAGRPTRWTGVITLVAGLSPLMYRAVRVGNVSIPAAVAIGLTVAALRRRSDAGATVGMYFGAMFKYATVALGPLLLIMGRWKVALLSVGLTILTAAVGVLLCGLPIFQEFLQTVGGSFAGSTPLRANQSIWGFLLRATQQTPLDPLLRLPFQVLQWSLLLNVFWQLWKLRRHDWSTGSALPAAAVALISWMLIFSPVFWEHYAVYLLPFWGWAAVTGTRSAMRRWVSLAAIALAWLPLPALVWLKLPEPVNSMLLASTFLMLAIALRDLSTRSDRLSGSIPHKPEN